MATKKLTDLSAVTEMQDEDLLMLGYGGTSTLKRITFANLRQSILGAIGTVTDQIKTAVLQAQNPVGSVVFNVTGDNPNSYLGFGTWVLFGAGRCLVCVDSTQTEFNTAEKTGGSKNMQSHTHTGGAHTHGMNNHTHGIGSHTHGAGSLTIASAGAHTHKAKYADNDMSSGHNRNYYSPGGNLESAEFTKSAGAHTHAISGATAAGSGNTTGASGNTASGGAVETGSAGTGNAQNLQPYITCYVWKRTA